MKLKFADQAHHAFFVETLNRANCHDDPYRCALFYMLGLTEPTRRCINDVYDFNDRSIRFEGLHAGWQTGTSTKITRMAFNLYNGFCGEPGEGYDENAELYSVSELFNNELAPYCFEAIKLRFPEHNYEVAASQQQRASVYLRVGNVRQLYEIDQALSDSKQRAWIYARIANKDDYINDFESQVKKLISYAQNHGMYVVNITHDTGSGLDYGRSGLKEICRAATQGYFNTLIIQDINRLGRDIDKNIMLMKRLYDLGIDI